jgi:hypothetical protein
LRGLRRLPQTRLKILALTRPSRRGFPEFGQPGVGRPACRACRRRRPVLAVCKASYQAALNRLEAVLSRRSPALLTILNLDTVTGSALVGADGGAAAAAGDPGGGQVLMRRIAGSLVGRGEDRRGTRDDRASLGLPTVPAKRAIWSGCSRRPRAWRRWTRWSD